MKIFRIITVLSMFLTFLSLSANAQLTYWVFDDSYASATDDVSYSDNGQSGIYTMFISTNGYTTGARISANVTVTADNNRFGINAADYAQFYFFNAPGSPAGSTYSLSLNNNTEAGILVNQNSGLYISSGNVVITNTQANAGAAGIKSYGNVSVTGVNDVNLTLAGHKDGGAGIYADKYIPDSEENFGGDGEPPVPAAAYVEIDGMRKITISDNSTGVMVLNGSTVTIKNSDLEMEGNTADFVLTGEASLLEISGSSPSLRKNAQFISSAVNFSMGQGTAVNIADMNITTDADIMALLEDGAVLTVDNSSIELSGGGSLFKARGDNNGVVLNNAAVTADSIIAADTDNFTLTSNNSALTGGINGNANFNLTGGSLTLTMNSSVSSITADNTAIYLSPSDKNVFNTLAVSNYTAVNNPVIHIYSALNQNNSSKTDKLYLEGDAAGHSYLQVYNKGGVAGLTKGDGILVIESETANNADFSVLGGKVDTGGYEYLLYKGSLTAGVNEYNWYLRSTGKYTEAFKSIVNTPSMAAVMAKTGMNELNKRLGDLRNFNNAQNKHGAWGRAYLKKVTVSDLTDTDITMFGAEAGYDFMFENEGDGRFYAGVMAGYLINSDTKTEQDNGFTADGDGAAPSIGAYATWINDNGVFIDFAVRNFWTELDMTSYASDSTPITYKPKRVITAFSAEAGKQFVKEMDNGGFLRLEPKAELMFSSASGKNITAGTGLNISYDGTTYFSGKIGVLAGYAKKRSNGLMFEPVAQISYAHEFDGKGDVEYGGVKYESDLSGGAFEGMLGLNMHFGQNAYLYVQGSYEAGSVIKGFGANAGFRMGFGGSAD